MKRLAALFAIVLLILFLGCSRADSQQDNLKSTQENAQSSSVKETVQQKDDQEELVLSFVGDMMFDKSVAGFIKSKGEDYVFEGYGKHFESSDIVFGNLETALSSKGQPIKEKEFTFRSSPKLALYLKKYNFTALSIANNHILDFGPSALTDTMNVLKENDISYGGGGYNKQEALNGVVIEKKGLRIGFIAFTRVTPSVDWYAGAKRPGIIGAYKAHEVEVLEAVKNLNEKCDLLVVSLHWGKEGSIAVRKEETELAHKLVDSGADVIVGHHPHVVQGIEMYNDRPIFYSLGNFIFTTSHTGICNKTIMATVRYDNKGVLKSVKAVPGTIKWGRPVPMEETEKQEFIDCLNKMNINLEL
jgi:poly-gamma-glutamate capsule biosynthesis protein CapA/YwtB (metallophosphatase superfamily)